MATSRTNRERGDIPAGPADLQPGRDSRGSRVGSPGGLAVSAAELATLESDEAAFDEPSRRAAERLARLAVDRDLHDRLAAGRFRGRSTASSPTSSRPTASRSSQLGCSVERCSNSAPRGTEARVHALANGLTMTSVGLQTTA